MSNDAEHSRLAAIFAGGTLFSRVLGLLRDLVLVLIPAASRDAFIVAFKFPNMLRDLIGEGASNAAFVPVFSESLEKDSEEEYRELVSAAMSMMIVVLGTLTALGVFLLPHIIQLLNVLQPLTRAEEVPQDRIDLMISLSCWTFPYLFFIGLAIFMMAPLFTMKRYAVPSWSPALLNIAIITTCLLLRDRFAEPAYALVVGVWLGGAAQLGVQYVALGRVSGVWRPNFKLAHPGVRTILWLLLPVLLGQSAGEINKLVDILFAASLEEGTVSALFYANRLVQLPLSIFGIATAVAILPSISRAAARGSNDAIRDTLMQGLRQSFFPVFPAMIGLMVMGRPVVRLLFEYQHFTPEDTTRTATALLFYAAGLLSFAWVKVAVSGFYGVQDTKTPVIIASGSMLLNILLNCVLVGPLGFRGLALATTISFTINFLFLYLFLCERFGRLWDAEFLGGLLRMAVAGIMMGVVAYGVYYNAVRLLPPDGVLTRAAVVFLPVAAAVIAYVTICWGLKVPELKNFLSVFRGAK